MTAQMRQLLREENLKYQLKLARAAVARVSVLHASYASPRGPECIECLRPFPCRTRRALAGGPAGEAVMARGPAGALREPVKLVRCLRCTSTLADCECRHG